MKRSYRWVFLCLVALAVPAWAETNFEGAVADYNAGRFAQAKAEFEQLIQAAGDAQTTQTAQSARAAQAPQTDQDAPADQGTKSAQAAPDAQAALQHLAESKYFLAVSAFGAADYGGFASAANAFIAQVPNAPAFLYDHLRYQTALIPFMQGKWDEAKASLDGFTTAHPGAVEALDARIVITHCLFNQNAYAEFTAKAQALVAQYGTQAEAKGRLEPMEFNLARVPFNQEKWAEAQAALEGFIAAHPNSAANELAEYYVTGCLLSQKDYAQFKAKAEAFIQKHPSGPNPVEALSLRYNLAMVPFNQQKWAEAKPALEGFAQAHPDATQILDAQLAAARSIFNLGSYDEAKTKAQALMAQYGDKAKAGLEALNFDLACVPFNQEKWAEAKTALAAHAAAYPGSATAELAEYDAAQCLMGQKAYAEFKQQAQELIQKHPAGPSPEQAAELRYCLAFCCFETADYAGFASVAEDFLTKYPNASADQRQQVQYNQALVPYRQEKWAEAKTALEAFAQAQPEAPLAAHALYKVTECLANQKSYEDYKQAGEAFLAKYPSGPTPEMALSLRYGMARVPYLEEKWDEARAPLEAFVTSYPDAAEALEARIAATQCLYHLKSYDEFKTKAQALLARPDAADKAVHASLEPLSYNLAQVPMNQGKWAEAKPALEAHAAAYPDAPLSLYAQYQALECLSNLHAYDEFKQAALAYLEQHPAAPSLGLSEWLRYNVAMIPYNQNKYTEAVESLGKYATEHPYSPSAMEARFNAIMCLYLHGDYEAFRDKALSFLMQYPKAGNVQVGELQFTIARSLLDQGKYQEAMAKFEQIITMDLSPKTICLARLMLGQTMVAYAESIRKPGNESKADETMAKARMALKDAREKTLTAIFDEVNEGNRIEMATTMLETCFNTEKDITALARTAQALSEHFRSATKDWAYGLFWLGIARMSYNMQDLKGAGEAFDSILNAHIEDSDLGEHLPTQAIYWRISVAQAQGDNALSRDLITKIRNEMPDGPVKVRAMEQYGPLLNP